MNIFLVGHVATGKSSLLNAIVGEIVSSPYNQREIITHTIYEFRDYIDLISKSKSIFKSHFQLGNFFVYDFTGLNSVEYGTSIIRMIDQYIIHCHLMVFVTDADSAFLSQSELESYKKISELCDAWFVPMCIAVNKFDNLEDPNHNYITNQIRTKINDDAIKIFRISSHRLLLENIFQHQLKTPISDEFRFEFFKMFRSANAIIPNLKNTVTDTDINQSYLGDWDNFIDFLRLTNTHKLTICDLFRNYLNNIFEIPNEQNIRIKEYDQYQKFIDVFTANHNVDEFIEIFTDSFFNNMTNVSISLSLCIHTRTSLNAVHNDKFVEKFANQLLTMYQNDENFPNQIFNLFMYMFRIKRQSIKLELVLYLLKDKRMWLVSSALYCNIRDNLVMDLVNRIDSNRFTDIMNQINILNQEKLVTEEIIQLIRIAIMPYHDLMLLSDNLIRYDLINKYLGKRGEIRTRFYIKKKYSTVNGIPFLFDENSEIPEYNLIKDNLFKIYTLLRFSDRY